MIRSKVSPSVTLGLLQRVREARAQGLDVASFAAGEPDFPTPDFIIDAATASMKRGNTHYVETQGVPVLRSAVADDYKNRLGVAWITKEHVLVAAGAKQGIYLALTACLELDDEVIVPQPYWVSYPDIVKLAGGKVHFLETQEAEGFFPTVEELEKAKTSRTRALIFSSPGNPTGTMISEKRLRETVQWCVKNKVIFIYDEIYERLVLSEKAKHFSALAMVSEEDSEWVISVNALSKTLAMTGWRIGYVMSSKANIKAMNPIQSQMITCMPGFSQEAAAEGLKRSGEILPGFVEIFKKRLELILGGLKRIPNVRVLEPTGAFYICLDVREAMKKKGIPNDLDFAEKLFAAEQVAVVPGNSMGMPGWLRLSFAMSEEEIKKGLLRLARFCS